MTQNEKIKYANSARYSDTLEVDGYLERPYHKLRLELAKRSIVELAKRNFADAAFSSIQIVEFGAASGNFSMDLQTLGFDVTATDCEEKVLCNAEKRGLKTEVVDVTVALPWANETYHIAFAGELIEHIFDTEQFLNECRRILRPGGILVLTTPNMAGLQDRINFLFGKAPRQVDPIHEYLRLHIRPFTAASLRSALQHCGFQALTCASNHVRLDFGHRKFKSRSLGILFPTLGGSLIISAERTN